MPRFIRAVGLIVVAGAFLALTACSGSKDRGHRDGIRSRQRSAAVAKGDGAGVGLAEVAAAEDRTTERYQHREDNPFLLVSGAPLSTFSIEVDTASYSNVRRHLKDGQLPPADAVKIEELINYFPYRYPQPRDGQPVSLTGDLARCPWNAKHLLLRVGLRGKTFDAGQLPARNLVFLVDTSGSMSPANRLPLLKEALKLLVLELSPRDRVALVTYAGSAGVALPPTPGTDKPRILKAIDELGAGGATYGEGGIRMAYQLAQEHFDPQAINRVILGTDGDFNVGLRNTNELIHLIQEKRKTGIYLTVLGFGMGNLKDDNLEMLAHHGNGHHAYIDTLDEARKLFVDQGAALVTIAKDVKLQLEFNPRRVGAYRLIGYENRLLRDQDFKDDKKDAGDMGSGHTVTALYELVPAGQAINIPGVDPLKYQQSRPTEAGRTDEWLTVKLRYKQPDKESSEEMGLPLRAEPVALESAPEDFRFAASVAAFGMLLRDSRYKGEATFELAADLASRALGHDPHGLRAEFFSLVRKAQALRGK